MLPMDKRYTVLVGNYGSGKTELAIAIVAELVDVRYRQRYSAEARERHEKSLGR